MATKEDRAILNCVFNPLQPDVDCLNEEIIPEDLSDNPGTDDETVLKEIRSLELQAIKAAESGELDKAVDIFSKVIQKVPGRPASYNNRAQARRLKGDIEGAMEDLNAAIEVSGGTGRSACLSLCQRGLVHRLHNRDEQAKEDFESAAAMGSKFAATQLVQMNAYAALCNDMLNKILSMYRI